MKLDYKVKKVKENEASFIFTATPKDLNEAKDSTYEKKFKADYKAKGFRKGQAPRKMFERDHGFTALQYEAINALIEIAYKQAFDKDEGFKILGFPELDIDQKLFSDVIVSPFSFTLKFPILPPVELGKYKELNVEKKALKVTDKELKEEIDKELFKGSKNVPKKDDEKIKDGDTAVIDFEGFLDGKAFDGGKAEKHHLKIGSKSFIPGFEEALVGLKKGDKKDVKLAFPKEYHAKDLAGKDVVFKVFIHEVQEEVLPKLTDDYVKELKIDKVKTVDSFKKHLKEEILKRKEFEEENRQLEIILDKIKKETKLNIHKGTIKYDVERKVESMKKQVAQYGLTFEKYLEFMKKTEEDFRKDLEKESKESLTKMIIKDEIIKLEKIKATEKEIKDRYLEIAKLYKIAPAQLKKQLPEDQIGYEIAHRKLNKYLIKHNVVEKKSTKSAKKIRGDLKRCQEN